jgi:uncharacterized membrane protein
MLMVGARTWAIIAMACAALLGSCAQILLKKANVQFDPSIIMNWRFLLFAAFYGIALIINIIAYRYGDVSILYPVISLSYLCVMVLAAIFLGERLTALKITGAIIIVIGVVMIAA